MSKQHRHGKKVNCQPQNGQAHKVETCKLKACDATIKELNVKKITTCDVEIKGNLIMNDCDFHGNFKHYADYVVVGAGAAGSVVAARLAQAGCSVILLEAGPDNSIGSKDIDVQPDLPSIEGPFNYINLYNRYQEIDPNAPCSEQWHGTTTMLDFVSGNQRPHENDPNATPEVYYSYPRGCGAGGSSNHHALQDGVGSLKVYDILAQQVGDNYWRGENMNRLFKNMEDLSNITTPANPGPAYAGQSGWLKIQETPRDAIFDTIINVVGQPPFNVPYRSDFKNPANVSGIGPGYVQVTASNKRSYAYNDLLKHVMETTGLVKVMFNHLATNLILKENNCDKYKCVGVEAYDKGYIQEVTFGASTFEEVNGQCTAIPSDRSKPLKKHKFYANKEVIVCGGAIQSPQLLLLSGIGPKAHLEQVGIECKVDLPGVGSNMTDHCEFSSIYEFDPKKFVPGWQAALLLQIDAAGGGNVLDPAIKAVCQANADPSQFDANTGALVWDWHSGFDAIDMSFPDTHTVPYTVFFWGFDSDLGSTLNEIGDPDQHLDHFRRNWLPNPANPMSPLPGSDIKGQLFGSMFDPTNPRVFISWLTENLKPGNANGTIRLRSADPCEEPILDQRLYEDDTGIERMARQIQQIRQVMEDPSIKQFGKASGYQVIPGPGAVTVADIKTVIKNWSSYGHHISGTCQMGPKNDPLAVVDSKLRVRNVSNLRIADTSVYRAPNLHAFNTTRAAYVMGEAVAERIIQNI